MIFPQVRQNARILPSINMDYAHVLQQIKAEIGLDNVTIEAVSKQQPQHKIMALLAAGHRVFAENKVQEALLHWEHLRAIYPDLRLHLIGNLQRNKAKQAVALFDVIETIDNVKLAQAVAIEAEKLDKKQHIMLQVNIGAEEQKSGVEVADLPALIDFCINNQWLEVDGLMCIPPYNQPPEPYFAQMKSLQQQWKLPHLSMGMSGDYMSAIQFGATFVRLGTALFGERTGR